MEKERRIKVLSLVALIVAVLGLTIAFAALSQTLTINGTASVNAASWDVHFENQKVIKKVGYAEASAGEIVNGGDTLDNVSVSLKQPRDSATIEVEIVNDGDINAEIEDIQLIENESNPNVNVWDYLEFACYYENGEMVDAGNFLKSKKRVKVLLTFIYSDSVEDVLSETASWSFSIKLIYRQSDKTGASTGTKTFKRPTSSELSSMKASTDAETNETSYMIAESNDGDMIAYSPAIGFSGTNSEIALIGLSTANGSEIYYFLESGINVNNGYLQPNIMYLVTAGSTSGSEIYNPYYGTFPFNDSNMTIYSQSYYEYVKGLFE